MIAGALLLLVFGSPIGKLLAIFLTAMSKVVFNASRPEPVTSGPILTSAIARQVKATWPIGVVTATLVIASFYLLHLSALHGHDSVAAVLLFTMAACCGMAYAVYVVNKATT
jgi:hypothetical protein